MELILKDGTRKQACDRCHRVNVTIRLYTVCDECRGIVGMPDSQIVRPTREPRVRRRTRKYRAEITEALLRQSQAV